MLRRQNRPLSPISKVKKVPKGYRWKYVVGGALVGAVIGAAVGFGLGYVVGGGSVVAVVGESGTAVSLQSIKIGNKLDYIFGKATGNQHNTFRSLSMYEQLKRVGIRDNKYGREFITQCILKLYKESAIIFDKVPGRVIREGVIAGPYGILKIQTIWEGKNLLQLCYLDKKGEEEIIYSYSLQSKFS